MKKLLCLFLVFLCTLVNAQRFVKEVQTISDLQALNPGDIHKSVFVKDPNRGGLFALTNTVSGTNTGTRFSSNTNGYSWNRVFSGPVNVKWFGAIDDNSTDNYVAITNAINFVSTYGGSVYIPKSTNSFNFGTGISIPATVQIAGEGARASKLKYTGTTGFAITVGHTDAGGAYFGCALKGLQLNLTSTTADAIQVSGTSGALFDDLYVEGIPVNTSTALYVNGGVSSTIQSQFNQCNFNHFKFGVRCSSSGAGQVTTADFVSCNFFGDSVAGSFGIKIETGNGDGVRFFGGNSEGFQTGANLISSGSFLNGLRFEANTTDILLDALARRNVIAFCNNVSTITDNAGSSLNVFYGNRDPSGAFFNDTVGAALTVKGALTAGGNVTLARNQGSTRYIILDNTTTGSLAMQAGIGSGATGGGIVLNGSAHANAGDVIAGLGGSATAKFRVNTDGLGGGTDALTVDATGNLIAIGGGSFSGAVNAGGASYFTNGLTSGANITLTRVQGGTRYILLDNTTTGSLLMQAGIGSDQTGGSIILRGSGHGNPGGVTIGLGSASARRFTVNQDGLGNSPDSFTVDNTGATTVAGTLTVTNKIVALNAIQLQGTTSSFPMITNSSTTIRFRLADDSAFAPISAGSITSSGSIQAGGTLFTASGANIGWGASTLITDASSDGRVQVKNNAGTSHFTMVADSADSLTLNSKLTLTNSFKTKPVTPSQITGNQNDYAIPTAPWLRLSTDASHNITGFVGKNDGHRVLVHNVGTQPIVFQNANVGSVSTNRFTFSTGADITVSANGKISLIYDGTTATWRDF